MPSHSLLKNFQQHLVLESSWIVNGQHYARTCNAWLKKLDDNTAAVRPFFEKTCAALWNQIAALFSCLFLVLNVSLVAQVRCRRSHHVDRALARFLLGLCRIV